MPPGAAQSPVTLKAAFLEQLRTTHTQQANWFVPLEASARRSYPGPGHLEAAGWRPLHRPAGQSPAVWNSRYLAKFKHLPEGAGGDNNDETFNAFDAARWDETRQKLYCVLSELEKLVSEADTRTLESGLRRSVASRPTTPTTAGRSSCCARCREPGIPAKGVK